MERSSTFAKQSTDDKSGSAAQKNTISTGLNSPKITGRVKLTRNTTIPMMRWMTAMEAKPGECMNPTSRTKKPDPNGSWDACLNEGGNVTIFPYLIFSAYLISSYLGASLISLPKISTYRTTFASCSPRLHNSANTCIPRPVSRLRLVVLKHSLTCTDLLSFQLSLYIPDSYSRLYD